MPLTRRAVPHVITASRVLVVAAAYFAAFEHRAGWVVALALVAVATDMLDGILARRWKVESVFGANLDSAVDFVFYLSLAVWVWMFDPATITALVPLIALFTAAYVAVLAVSKIKRGAMGFHNAWTRGAATVGVTAALATILFGWQSWFLVALLLALVADLGQRLAKIFLPKTRAPSAVETARR